MPVPDRMRRWLRPIASVWRRVAELLRQFRSWSRPVVRALSAPTLKSDPTSDVVVSLTSFPARIGAIWATIDTLLAQDAPLKAVVLHLSDEEFPGRSVPRSLRRRVCRGLTIAWVPTDRRSFDKLLPALVRYPADRIITVDDDKLYERDMVSQLVEASRCDPDAIVGSSGRLFLEPEGDGAVFGPILGSRTESALLYLLNGTGVLYPPGALPPGTDDHELIARLCPTDDDVWFWVMSVRAGTRRICLGQPKPKANVRQAGTPTLLAVNRLHRPAQMRDTFAHFGLESIGTAGAGERN